MATKAKRKKRKIVEREDITPERAARNEFVSAGMARRVVPMIDTLHKAGYLDDAQWKALGYYRDQASLADRSPVRSCCDTSPRGGFGPGVTIMSAIGETRRLERILRGYRDLARAIAVDDMSLTQWCIEQHGGRERITGGKVIAIMPRSASFVAAARFDLRIAANIIASAT